MINPPAAELGRTNAVVAGRARQYLVDRFSGPLSLKSVVKGAAVWETAAGRFEIRPGSALILNEGEEYSMVIDALHPVETFCLFFQRGFVEDACQSAATGSAALLDASPSSTAPFCERLQHGEVTAAMTSVRRALVIGLPIEPSIIWVAASLAAVQTNLRERLGRLPALRAATREELRRRVAMATEFLHANVGAPVGLADFAAAAKLSPFHLHRAFKALHGVTPHRHLTTLRLQRARALLECTDRSVFDIALDCGFESVTSFTTLFRRTFGAPPARFRKNREVPRVPGH